MDGLVETHNRQHTRATTQVDNMDLLKDLAKIFESLTGTPEPWRLFLAAIFLIFLLVERIGSLRSTWVNFRLGRDELSLEKQRLEIEKLRYEIEAIKKSHGLPDITPTPAKAIVKPAEPEVPQAVKLLPATQSWGWQIRFPSVATVLLRLAQSVLAFFGFSLGLSGLIGPFIVLSDKEMASSDWQYMLIGSLLNLFLAYGCYRGYRRLQRSIMVVRARPKTAAAGA